MGRVGMANQTEQMSKVGGFDKKKVFGVFQVIATLSAMFLIFFYLFIRGTALSLVDEFDRELALIQKTSFQFVVKVDREFPIETSLPLSRVIDVNQIIPVDQKVTTQINVPVVGRVSVTIPIKANIPVNLSIPIDKEFKVEIPKVSDQMINIKQDVPVKLDFVVEKSIVELGLSKHILQIHKIMNSLRLFFLAKPRDLTNFEIGEEVVESIDIVIN